MDELHYDLERDAVRVVLTDGGGRVLLFHVLTPDQAPDGWWELPGGGSAPASRTWRPRSGRSARRPGLVLDPAQVSPPSWWRDTTWVSRGKRRLQHEVVVRARIAADQPAIATAAGRRRRSRTSLTFRWWQVPEITGSRQRFYPGRLPELLPAFLAGEAIDEPFELWN